MRYDKLMTYYIYLLFVLKGTYICLECNGMKITKEKFKEKLTIISHKKRLIVRA